MGDVTCKRHRIRGSSCSDYLRISCREALIFLPRSHSIGLGLSHLQCKAERMRREGGEGGGGGWESTALTLTHPPQIQTSQRQTHIPCTDYESWHRQERRSDPRRSVMALPPLILQLHTKTGWEAHGKGCHPPCQLVLEDYAAQHKLYPPSSKIDGSCLWEECRTTQWKSALLYRGDEGKSARPQAVCSTWLYFIYTNYGCTTHKPIFSSQNRCKHTMM